MAAVKRRGANLPAETTSFVGRRGVLAEVKRLLSASRLVTLTGPGGVGKTRLSVVTARELRRAFADGVHLIELDSLDDAELLTLTVLHGLGGAEPVGDDLGCLLGHLRTREVLLVLDNCEHLVEGVGRLISEILRRCPSVRVLATSREALNIAGESVFVVPPLQIAAESPVDAGDASEAVALFAERATAAVAGFEVNAENMRDVALLCARLDGLPLAIELAAVLMRVMSVRELLDLHDQRFRLLARGNRAAASRHQTLRAAIDWSFSLCTDQERTVWARLSVFRGSFDLAMSKQLCTDDGLSGDEVTVAFAGLVDKSLLIREGHGSAVRHRMLETIRRYGQEKLRAAGEEEALRLRHRDLFLELAVKVDADWFGPRQLEWSRRLRIEYMNFRAALEFCADRRPDVAGGLRMAVALSPYWLACGQQREGRHWLDRLLVGEPSNGPLRTEALVVNAHLAAMAGEGRAALSHLATAQREDLSGGLRARAMYVCGLAMLGSDPARAVATLERGVELQRAGPGGGSHLPLALTNLGLARCINGETDAAIQVLEESQAICEDRGDRWLLAWSLMIRGVMEWRRGEPARATALLRRALQFKHELGDLLGVALAMEFLAWSAEATGDAQRAARLFGCSRTLFEPLGAYLASIGPFLTWHEECARRVRAELGVEEYRLAQDRGCALAIEGAVSYALGRSKTSSAAKPSRTHSTLTRRETQVAELVAEGLSNKEIAQKLVIAPRTADSHVEHILSKLGFTSRTQVVAWLARQQDRASPSEPVNRHGTG